MIMNTYDTINLNDYVWKQDLPFMEYIKSRGFEIIPIDYDNEMHYANNFLTIAHATSWPSVDRAKFCSSVSMRLASPWTGYLWRV